MVKPSAAAGFGDHDKRRAAEARTRRWVGCGALLAAAALVGCGVPRAAGDLAAAEASRAAMADDDPAVRDELRHQAAAWESLAALVRRPELGGIWFVDDAYIDLVERAAAIARRQRDLADRGADDPAKTQRVAEKLRRLWPKAAAGLGR